MPADSWIFDLPRQSAQLMLQACAPLRRRPVTCIPFAFEQDFYERAGFDQSLLDRVWALLADEVVGV